MSQRAGLTRIDPSLVPHRRHRLVCNVKHSKGSWATLVAIEAALIALYLFAFDYNKVMLVIVFAVACIFVFHPYCFIIEWRLRREFKREGM